MNLIFAVTEDQVANYAKLSELIEGSVCEKLAENATNIVALVRDNYNVSTTVIYSLIHDLRCCLKFAV